MGSALFEIEWRSFELDAVVVHLRGELDVSGRDLLAALLAALDGSGAPTVVLDLTDVSFVDVRSVRMWEEAAVRLRAGGRRLVVRNAPSFVRRLIGLAEAVSVVVEPDAATRA